MNTFGPLYCETPNAAATFPVEPWNAISSGVIVLFGLAALALVVRRTPRAIEFYVLCALLVVNGIGSILWHGLRERWALTLDVTPALIFLIVAVIVWARRVVPLWEIATAAAVLLALNYAMRTLDLGLRLPGRWGAMAPLVIAAGLWLVARSAATSVRAALTGGLALLSALAAFVFRSIDISVCAAVPMGTHFLWHVLLSAAAFLCLTTLVTLEARRPPAPLALSPRS
jgi:ceramidase